jgi:plastocyanin
MFRHVLAAAVAVLTTVAAACGGYGGPTPTGPGQPATAPPGAIVIDVIGINGARSFAPNPGTVPAGQTVVWHNVDSTIHRVVLDTGGFDTGNIAPGAFSAPMTLPAVGPYHCSLHPEMTGVIVVQ